MTAVTNFVDVEQMPKMLGTGMQEGMTQTVGQIYAVVGGWLYGRTPTAIASRLPE
jgi:hypothetical protein